MFGLIVNCTFIGKDTTSLVKEQLQRKKKKKKKKTTGSVEVKNPESSHI